jgi:hypothetical protein
VASVLAENCKKQKCQSASQCVWCYKVVISINTCLKLVHLEILKCCDLVHISFELIQT